MLDLIDTKGKKDIKSMTLEEVTAEMTALGEKSFRAKQLYDWLHVKLAESFLRMIKGNATDEDMDALEEAGALQDISHMPARVKCAVLGWHTMEELLKEEK